MRGFLLCCFLLGMMVDVKLVEGAFEEAPACDAPVQAATAKCRAAVAKSKFAADAVCKKLGKNYEEVKKQIAALKEKAEKQHKALREKEKRLASVQSKARGFAQSSAKGRKSLLTALARQKTAKEKADQAQKKAASLDKDLVKMRREADSAMEKAVQVAQTDGDQSAVSAAKDKAHRLYREMVDEKIKVATLHHQVAVKNNELTKVSQEVEKGITVAKKKADNEAGALKILAADRAGVARAKLEEAETKLQAATAKEGGTLQQTQVLQGKVNSAKADVKQGDVTVKSARAVEDDAKKKERKVADTKVDVGPLSMSELKEKAKKLAKTGGPIPGHQGPGTKGPSQQANEIKNMEEMRQSAKAAWHAAQAKLASAKSTGASQVRIKELQSAVDMAAANVKRITAQQHGAVKTAIAAAKTSGTQSSGTKPSDADTEASW